LKQLRKSGIHAKHLLILLAGVLILDLTACSSAPTSESTSSATASSTPAPTPAPTPRSDWRVSDPDINAMDGASTQFVSAGNTIRLVLCFTNGKPCSGGVTSVDLRTPCWIDSDDPGSYHRRIRIKFDDGKPRTESWGITDDHKSLIPPRPQAFVAELKQHKKFVVELGCDRSDPGTVVTIEIEGLQDALKQVKGGKTTSGV
jgi:hypothetical protein